MAVLNPEISSFVSSSTFDNYLHEHAWFHVNDLYELFGISLNNTNLHKWNMISPHVIIQKQLCLGDIDGKSVFPAATKILYPISGY